MKNYVYWNIGRIIVNHENEDNNRLEYGKEVLKVLSNELTKLLGKEYSYTNLTYVEPHRILIKGNLYLVFNYSSDIYVNNPCKSMANITVDERRMVSVGEVCAIYLKNIEPVFLTLEDSKLGCT